MQQRFGRDAPDVQAGAADLVLLDQADSHAELACAQRCRVSTTSAAENYEVKIVLCQSQ
jgi:hypothetical protein